MARKRWLAPMLELNGPIGDGAMSSPSVPDKLFECRLRRVAALKVAMVFSASLIAARADGYEIHDVLRPGAKRNIPRAKEILTRNPEFIDERNSFQETPLHVAARFGPLEIVELLIELKTDVNAVADNGFTPMHVVEDGEIAALLIRSGANFKLDSIKRPAEIDMTVRKAGNDKDNAEVGKTHLGIYLLDGDNLRLCTDPTERPTAFPTKGKRRDTVLMILKRQKE